MLLKHHTCRAWGAGRNLPRLPHLLRLIDSNSFGVTEQAPLVVAATLSTLKERVLWVQGLLNPDLFLKGWPVS